MANTTIKEVTALELKELLANAKPLLADFSETWSGPFKDFGIKYAVVRDAELNDTHARGPVFRMEGLASEARSA